MAKLLLTPENQIQQPNQLQNFGDVLKTIEVERLTKRTNEKSWNTVEVLKPQHGLLPLSRKITFGN